MTGRRWMVVIVTLVLVFCPRHAGAHQVDTVEFEFQRLDDQWRLEGEMDIAYMLPETRRVPGAPPLSRAAVMKAPPAELERIRTETEKTLRALMWITFAGREVSWRVDFPDFAKQPFELPQEAADWALLTTRVVIDPQPGAGELCVHWAGEEEAELIILTEDGDGGDLVSVAPGGSMVLLKKEADASISTPARVSWTSWVASGFRHVLPLGLDHMMFIIGLFLMAPKWRPLLGQSLCFTLAHSVTLAMAVLGVISPPSRPVEILIAFSIAFVGVENIISENAGRLRLALVSGFGLVHGMGFASVLAEKLDGVPRDRLVMPLLGFNLGVEFAQLVVLGCCFLVFQPLSRWPRQVRIAGSSVVALFGLTWMISRIVG